VSHPHLERQQIEAVILTAIHTLNMAREPDNHVVESPTAALYGTGSPLDSLGLVSLLMEIEEGLRDEGIDISLSDERAMSQKHSPFRSVPSLVSYIDGLLTREST
jgi:acyl carrier protein